MFNRWIRAPGSMSPERVPMTSPASGVRPIEVSMLTPPRTAQAEAPLPRCKVIVLVCATGRPRKAAAARLTYACDVPWKP